MLEVLAAVRQSNPQSLSAISKARRRAINDVARRRHIDSRTVLDKCYRQMGLASVSSFDELIESWLIASDSALQNQILSRSGLFTTDADRRAISAFFGNAQATNANGSNYSTFAVLKPFKEKADADYIRHVLGGTRIVPRRHETLVNSFAKWLAERGIKPARNTAVDLGIDDPPVVVEAEYVSTWPRSVREAVGQLYEYRYFQVVRPDAQLVFLASKPIPKNWQKYLEEDRLIAVAWKARSTFILSEMARAALGIA